MRKMILSKKSVAFALAIFNPRTGDAVEKKDSMLDTSLRLCRWGDRLLGIRDDAIWEIKTRK